MRAGRVFHQQPRPTVLITIVDPADAARVILRSIEQMHHARQVGAYLFVSPSRDVYLVAEDRAWMQQCLREFHKHAWLGWFVGYYKIKPRQGDMPALKPDKAGILEDLVDHLRGQR